MQKRILGLFIMLCLLAGCGKSPAKIERSEFSLALGTICKNKYQTHISCQEAGDTIWVYMPYTMQGKGRMGFAVSDEVGTQLQLEYTVASFNPFKTKDPAELRFIIQKVIGEIRELFLRTKNPFKFFVLVVVDISDDSVPQYYDYYIGYFDDIRDYMVGKDFSGEGYSRLAWHQEPVKEIEKDGKKIPVSYMDRFGDKLDYHEFTMRDFVVMQIKWRIYKRFTVEYNRIPFNLDFQEKQDEVAKIIRTVLAAYNFKELENFYLWDKSFLDEAKQALRIPRQDIEKSQTAGITRKPAF